MRKNGCELVIGQQRGRGIDDKQIDVLFVREAYKIGATFRRGESRGPHNRSAGSQRLPPFEERGRRFVQGGLVCDEQRKN
ncbi:MAG: hypothetical protein ACXVFD_09400 [Gaiellaceae bacterium]